LDEFGRFDWLLSHNLQVIVNRSIRPGQQVQSKI
jgi:hypothetical protein